MTIKTTCISAYPKPDYVPISDWFQVGHDAQDYTDKVIRVWERHVDADAVALMDKATEEVVADQIACGITVPTDGEVRRENYVYYQCRQFKGFDFENLTRRTFRNGALTSELPTIRGPVRRQGECALIRDWQIAEQAADRAVKITLPGPMTISDTTADAFYEDPPRLANDLADALNGEILASAAAGCRHIQIDEPVFARKPAQALEYGVEALERCFHGVPSGITRVMHMCCGYPNRLDQTDYPKADPQAYIEIAKAIDGIVEEISIEDSHRHNPPELFQIFSRSALIVGFVTIASSTVETVDEIRNRMQSVLEHLPNERLIAAPDCSLGFLGRDLAMQKLRNLCATANSF